MDIDIPVLSGAELRLPQSFKRLYEVAYNIWWSWDPLAYRLWQQIDPQLWDRYRNPVELLGGVEPSTWEALEASESFLDLYRQVVQRFDRYLAAKQSWYQAHHGGRLPGPVAYLCAEFGIYHVMPLYSGGLGVLAGEHVKSASDLGIPFVAVGLLYRRGYFRQEVDAEGHQQHHYPVLDLNRLPVRGVAAPTGGQLKVSIDLPGRRLWVAVWKLQAGRVPLLLLDTDVSENDPADRPITHTLYVRGREMRFCQELVLGIGGVRALEALDIEPSVWHVNEGHAALSLLERLRQEVSRAPSLDDAERRVRASTMFTLHTPVPAGNEIFDFRLVEKYLSYWATQVGADLSYLGRLGAQREGDDGSFDLSALGIRLAAFVNGVSRRHASVVSQDWGHLLFQPVRPIPNGVHTASWAGRATNRLLTEHVGRDWEDKLLQPEAWSTVADIPDEELWQTHLDQKRILTRFARGRMRRQLARQGVSPDELRAVEGLFSPEWLTIGFARRFATYKRATLLFHNLPWLQSILTNPDRPVQVVIAGKAHPADRAGQELIRRIVELSRTSELYGHIYFLEDYDLRLGRFLVQGVDVWLNSPRPPQEASGTSGMKAAINGGLNLSILDGWWAEGHNGKNGWAFGLEWGDGDHARQDNEDAVSLYQTLQDEVVPLFYDRGGDDVPHGWVAMMKEAMASITPAFSTHRMVVDYATEGYLPLAPA
ncbi:MAG: alpha-glucan family phosphorylase [Actinomycetota bacterium]|nr:alpha-glucan family phosphorylase [Actinomycetota bacterium]